MKEFWIGFWSAFQWNDIEREAAGKTVATLLSIIVVAVVVASIITFFWRAKP